MAGSTSGSRQVVIAVDVAVETSPWRLSMRIRERKAHCRVIKRRRLPRPRSVALLAGLREASSDVVRVLRTLKIR